MTSEWYDFQHPTGESIPRKQDDNTNINFPSDYNSAWPIDDIMNEIEIQMNEQNEYIAGMTKQLEDIETSLAHHATSSSSRPKRIAKKKSKRYIEMGNGDDDDIPFDESVPSKSNSTKYNKASVLHVLKKMSALKTNEDDDKVQQKTRPLSRSIPEASSGFDFDVATAYSVSTKRSSNRKVSPEKLRPPHQSQLPRGLLKFYTPTSLPVQQEELPPPSDMDEVNMNGRGHVSFAFNTLPQQLPPSDEIHKTKRARSLTWEESVSSNSNGDKDADDVSDLGDTTDAGKTWAFRSNKAKFGLIAAAFALCLMAGLLIGQLAQGRKDEAAMLQQQQQQQNEKGGQQQQPVFESTFVPSSSSTDQRNADPNDALLDSEDTETTTNPPQSPSVETESAGNTDTDGAIDESPTIDYTADTNLLVGVYYYPWHGDNFHNGDGYMRKELTPAHQPSLGEYNDSDPAVVAEHMKMFRKANIGLLVTSWWGPNRIEDSNTKDVIMEHEDVGNLKIALHYETTGRLVDKVGTDDKLENAKTDVEYMCEHYFNHPNYYKIDGRPVIFMYVSRVLHSAGTLEQALLTMRSTASRCGHNLYLIGDSVFEKAPDSTAETFVPFWYFDAVTNYDVYGSQGRPNGYAGMEKVDAYYQQQALWKEQAIKEGCHYIPAVSPGYNDRGVRMESNHPPLSRRLTANSSEGSLFHYQLKQAMQLVDTKVDNLMVVNSFNEWHEDTQIEPAVGDPATAPFNYTQGLEYVGYGDLYLDILGAATSKDESKHNMFDHLLAV
jgi:hypothetical protein